jgi:hypothetical protein
MCTGVQYPTLVYKEKVSQQFLETVTVQEETVDECRA